MNLKNRHFLTLKDYSKEDFYDSLCYLADKTSKTKDDLGRK